MAALFRKSWTAFASLYMILLWMPNCLGLVHELTHGNIEKFLKDKVFVLTFVDSPSCTRCRILFPFFVAASQVFPHDPEIFFTRTHDKQLIKEWGVNELPALIYHMQGMTKHEFLDADNTVDDIIDAIARTLHGNFAGLTRTYSVHIDGKIYDEVIVTPKQSALLLIHDKHDKEAVEAVEKVAFAFRKDDAILIATLDASKHRDLRDEKFKTKDTPIVMWLGQSHKNTPKRFGGVLSQELLTQFINEQTGLNRDHDGAMQKEAGRIPEADEIIDQNIDKIIEGDAEDLKNLASEISKLKSDQDSYTHEMLEYYVYVIDNIVMTGGTRVLRDMTNAIEEKLFGGEETTTKNQETMKRRINILLHFRALEKEYIKDKKEKTKEELMAKMEEKRTKKTDETVIVEQHSHVHTEL